MKIYPDVDYHLFITASLEECVKRRCIQYNENENKNSVRKNIILRDILQRIAGFYGDSDVKVLLYGALKEFINCVPMDELNNRYRLKKELIVEDVMKLI